MKRIKLFNIATAALTAAIIFLAGTISAQIDEFETPPAGLNIVKEVNSRLAHYGDNIYYTLRVSNSGPEPFADIEVTDALPLDVEYLDGSASHGGVYDYDSRLLIWNIPSLKPAETVVLTFTMTTASYGFDTLVILNSASIISPVTQKSNWVITWIKPNIPPQAVLDIEKTADKANAHPGDTITYTLTAINSGEASAFNFPVTDNLPAHSQIIPGSVTSGGIYDAANGQIRWLITELAPGAGVSLNFQVTVNLDAPLYSNMTNIGLINFPDSTIADTAITIINPPPGPYLTIDKTVDSVMAYPGDTLTYNLFIRNSGDAAAFELSLIDPLPAEVTYIPGSATNGVVYDEVKRQLVWSIPAIEPEQSIDLSFRAAILPDISAGTNIANFAIISGPDPTFSDTVTTTVLLKPITRLTIDKSVDKPGAYRGETLTYTLFISNSGNTVISPVDIRDPLPQYSDYVPGSITGGGSYDFETSQFIWFYDAIEPGESHEVSFKVVIHTGQEDFDVIDNLAYTISPEGIFSDTVRTYIKSILPPPNIFIDKTVDKAEVYPGDTLTYDISAWHDDYGGFVDISVVDSLPENTILIPGTLGGDGYYSSGSGLIFWEVQDVFFNDTVKLHFEAIADPATKPGEVLVNYAYFPETDIIDSTITTVIPRPTPHLVIEKMVDKSQANAGDTLAYSIIVGNNGDLTAYDVNIHDGLPQNSHLVEGSIDNGGIYSPSAAGIIWNIPELGVEEQVVLSFKAVVDESVPFDDQVINSAMATITDQIVADTVITTIIPYEGIRLHFEKSVAQSQGYPGDILDYNLFVRNVGSQDVVNVSVADTLSPLTTYIPGTASHGGLFVPVINGINWTLPIVASGESVILSLRANINSDAPVNMDALNIAVLTHVETEMVDSASTRILEKPTSDLTLDKSVDKIEAYAGETLTYTLHLKNTGETAVSSVKIQDPLPPYTWFVPGSVTGVGNYDFETYSVFWVYESLPPGADLELSFKARVDEDAPVGYIISNYAMIYSPEDISSDTVHTTVIEKQPVTSLRLDKSVNKATAERGEMLTYSILVENNGETLIETATPTDFLPPYINVIEESITHGGIYNSETSHISWEIGNLEPSNSITLTFAVEIDMDAPIGINLDNFALTTVPVPAYSDTVRTVITDQQGEPNLTVDKNVDLAEAYAGDILTYTILVKNEGDGPADGVTISDNIPAYTSVVESSISEGGFFDEELNLIRWELESLIPGSEILLSFRVTLESLVSDEIEIMNIAQAYLGESMIADTVYTDILSPEQPDILKIVKQVDSLVAARGSIITYDISVTNTSDGYVSGIMVWDTLPTYTSYVAGSVTAGGDYDAQLNRITWNWQNINIAPGHTIELSFKAYINSNAPGDHRLNNIAYTTLNLPDGIPVKAAVLDTFPSNVVTTIVNVPTGPQDDPVIFKEVDQAVAAPGNTLTYTITITNPGPDPINPVMVADDIPDHTTYVPGSASGGGTYNGIGDRVSWTFGPLAVDESAVLSFQVTIDDDAVDDSQITNRAGITDPVPVQSNQTITLVRSDLFLLNKAVNRSIVAPGDTVTYSIIYNNATGVVQNNVTLTDILEPELNYVPGSASNGGVYSSAGRSVVWNLGNLAIGAIGTVQFRAVVSADAEDNMQIDNIAIASGQSFGPVNSQNVVITVQIPQIDLFKEAVPSVAAPGDIVTYTVIMGNHEPSAVTNAALIDDIPDGFTYVAGSATISEGVVVVTGADPLSFNFGELPYGIGYELTYQLTIPLTADLNEIYTNSAVFHGRDQFGRNIEVGPVSAEVSLQMPRLRLTKTSGVASGIVGSLIPFTILVENISDVTFTGVFVTDSMPDDMFYVSGTSLLNGVSIDNPAGSNPYYWNIGNMTSGQSVTLQYTAQLGSSARPGVHENVAWAQGNYGSTAVRTAEAFAQVSVLPTTIPGAIRGRVAVDCDGDGVAESEDVPVGADIYLDDGSQSKVNEKGMFYFGTVRPGVRVVALDIRDLDGFYVPEEAEASVFVHVNESGESYITFRVCPMLKIEKKAAILPKVKVTKAARLKSTAITDTSGVTIDYEIIIQTNGGALPTLVKVVDSFPDETRLIIHQDQPLTPRQTNNVLTYEVTVQEQKMQQSVYYSLEDLSPGIRRFLTNKIYLEGDVSVATEKTGPVFSPPTEVSVGPFKRIPSRDIQLNVVGALFETSRAKLQPEAFPVLQTVADTALKYLDAALRIEGHADYRPIRTREFPSNWELSSARAKAVVDWLVTDAGIDSARVTYEGFAATRPVDTGRTAEALQKNRRVEVLIKARQEGGIDMSQITTDKWANMTSLELNPVRYDSMFITPSIPIETGLDDTWEVLIIVENGARRATAEAIVRDSLPSGVILNNDKVWINGREIPGITNTGGIVEIPLGSIPARAKVEIRYRVKAIEGSLPAGGGRAVLSVSGKEQTLTRESNSVTF